MNRVFRLLDTVRVNFTSVRNIRYPISTDSTLVLPIWDTSWEIFTVKTQKRHRRRVLQGLRLVSEDAEAPQMGADAAGAADARQV